MFFRQKKAQSVAEYAALLAVITAAILGVKVYFQRAIQGKVKVLVNQVNEYQYNPQDTQASSDTTTRGSGTYGINAMETVVTGHEESSHDFSEFTKGDVIEQ
ncbi:MAG: hypothetical protein NC914_00045 [Candidatus Omnitrophica bacterium]|nr:hypothetical protein [Candidatus Omnitrophota bacterium]